MPNIMTSAEKLECVLVHVGSINFWIANGRLHVNLVWPSGNGSTKIVDNLKDEIDHLYNEFC